MQPQRTFLFDLDGTLIDSIELIRRSFVHTLVTWGRPEPTREEWLVGVGMPLRDQFARYTSDAGEVDELIAIYRTWNHAHHDEMVSAYPGIAVAVDALLAAGGRLGVVTSKNSVTARRGLEVSGLDGRFEVLIGSEHVEAGKPAPDPILLALERMGVRAEDAVYVGDSTSDLAAGRAAGTRTAAALWGPLSREELAPHAPDVWLETPAEIAELAAVFPAT